MREDPPLDARCRDKFLVQSVSITPDKESSNIATIVSHLYSPLLSLAEYDVVAKCRADLESRNPRTEDTCCLLTCFWRSDFDVKSQQR